MNAAHSLDVFMETAANHSSVNASILKFISLFVTVSL